jgi:hypothetical protein
MLISICISPFMLEVKGQSGSTLPSAAAQYPAPMEATASSGGRAARNVYLAAIEPGSGKTMVALGLMDLLSRRLGRVGYFRPVIAGDAAPDEDIELIRRRYRLAQAYEDSWAVTLDDLRAMSDRGRYDVLLKRILEAFRRLDRSTDLVLVEGGDFTGASRALELDFNAELANHLGCLVLLVIRGSRWGRNPRSCCRRCRRSTRRRSPRSRAPCPPASCGRPTARTRRARGVRSAT